MKLFIHTRVTLEYFNFKRPNKFKSLLSISITLAMTARGNEIDPHLNRHNHLFKGSLNL